MSGAADPWAVFRQGPPPDAQGDPWARFRQSAPVDTGQPAGGAEAEPVQMASPETPRASFGQRFIEGIKDVPAGFDQAVANTVPEGSKPVLNAANRILQALPITALTGRMLGQIPSADEANTAATDRERAYRGTKPEGFDWARTAGNVAATAPFAAAIPAAGGLTGAVATGAATGAALGGMAPVPGVTPDKPYGYQAAENAAIGGIGGGVGGAVGHVVGGLIAPRIAPNVRTLADAGVEVTPGQILGGTARTVEDGLRSTPGVGYPIAKAQERAVNSFNRAVANEVLAPVGESVPRNAAVGRELLQSVDDTIGQKYGDALSRVNPFRPDAQFLNDVRTIAQTKFLTPESQTQFINILRNDIDPRIGSGPITGETLQKVTSVLKEHQRGFSRSLARADHEVADALRATVTSIDDLVARTNPTVAPQIAAANAAWARLVRMREAAGGIGAKEGVFSGPQFAAAVRGTDSSAGHRQYAMGNALMQKLSDAGTKVLPATVPDSGTATRAGLMTAGGAIGSGIINPALMAAYLGSVGGSSAAYSEPATRAFRAAMLARRPEAVQALAEALRRTGGVAGGATAGRLAPPPLPPQ